MRVQLLTYVCVIIIAAAAVSAAAKALNFAAKNEYIIAGVDIDGPGSFKSAFAPTFVTYLNEIVAPQFSPPINFRVRTMTARDAADAVATGDVDFAFLDPIVASCAISASFGSATAILTMRRKRFGVDMLRSGGAIVVRSDRSDIANFADLQDKRIAASDPNSLFGYQAQLSTLSDRGLNIHLLSSQIIFTQSRVAVLQEVYSGRADVGFVEAGRLENAEDEGRFPPSTLRSIEPITNHVLSGSQLFPFEVSTLLYPNAPLVMHSSVDSGVQALVTVALLSINSTSTMATAGDYQGWRPAANYLEVLSAMQLAGIYDPAAEQCVRVSTLRDSIICPEQYTSKSEVDLATSCDDLVCPTPTSVNDTYTCICSACEPSCGKNEVETEPGVCKCRRGFVIMAGKCVPLYAQILVIVFPILVLLFVFIRLLLKWQQKRSDQMWHIKPHELEFDDPAICLGSGSFGVVLQAEYRGSVVALKSILPRGKKLGTSQNKMATSHARFGGMLSRPGAASTRAKSGARRGLFASGFDYIENTYERGLQKLKRALAQAAEAAEAAREDINSTEDTAVGKNKSHTKGAGSVLASGRHARHLSAGSRSTRKRTLSTVLKTRAQNEREDFVREMRLLSKLRHPCVATVIGAVLEPNCPPILVMEHMDLGSLHSLLHNPSMDVDDETMRMMMLDIVHGCRFLHAFEPPVIHGDLKSMNVLVDSRFRAKVADFGLSQRKACAGTPYFMAPELLRGAPNSIASDVYAFGVVLFEMTTKLDPYEGEDFDDVIQGVVKDKKRPELPRGVPSELATVMRECWHWDPRRRPTFLELERRMAHFDSLHVAERNMKRNRGNNVVLDQVFPAHVAKALANGQKLQPEHYDKVTIFFSDIVGFTDISKTVAPATVCDMLDRLYTRFDILTEKYDIFKVESIGDAYMAATNLHRPQKNHADRIARFALDAVKAAQATLIDESDPQRGTIKLRVGFHTGPVVANVVGTKNPRYCLFGDTVNTASRMESSSEAMSIHLSGAAQEELVCEKSKLSLTSRGVIDIKGKGRMETFWLDDSAAATGRRNDAMSETAMQIEVNRRRSSRLVHFESSSTIVTDAGRICGQRDQPSPHSAESPKSPPAPSPLKPGSPLPRPPTNALKSLSIVSDGSLDSSVEMAVMIV